MFLLKKHTIFKKGEPDVVARYTVIEWVGNEKFYVLHTDFLRQNQEINHSYFESLTVERLIDTDPSHVSWSGSIEKAIRDHDDEFEEGDI
jgi:hypothetical protein